MKLHFEDNLDYQKAAIESVVQLFKGQEVSRSEFTLAHKKYGDYYSPGLSADQPSVGLGNRLQLVDEEIHDNLKAIQRKNFLPQSEKLTSGDFTVEMETGTGKTYVYLRTIFELNKNYGFTKFVIVVPSIAIKEGTNKTLEITREHFEGLYPKAKGYDFFQYDSSKPGQVKGFATSSNIQVMVATVGAVNKKDVNNLYKDNENTDGYKPIDLIKATRPIIIVDEPQSVDGGLSGKGKQALDAMNPLAKLRYSATHIDKHQMVYRLGALDAYERGLVKQIEVASLELDGGFNKAYVKLIEAKNVRGAVMARVELHVQRAKGVKPEIFTVKDGDDLEQVTSRAVYKNMLVGTITCGKGNESIEIRAPGMDAKLRLGEAIGNVNPDAIRRQMIHRTIKEHFDKELRFARQGLPVKVLSLFFIDKVEHYRSYDKDGNEISGKYVEEFEQEYRKLAESSDYQMLFAKIDLNTDVSEAHDGYFSIDKKQRWIDTAESNQAGRENAERAYNLIMKDKEKLLSFNTKLKFIFSHSALKEGWDNPNVFQICSLRDIGTERERRQTIGRGLRLCVNQEGVRLRGNDINTLTVIASEGYEEFAEKLQKEIEADTGIRFGVVAKHQFATIQTQDSDGNPAPLGVDASEKIWAFLNEQKLIDNKGKVQDSLREALKSGAFDLPEEFQAHKADATAVLTKLAGKLEIKNANQREPIRLNKERFLSDDFKQLWDRIKYKTTYRINFDNEKLIIDAAQAVRECPPITKTRARFRKAGLEIGKGGVDVEQGEVSSFTTIDENDIELPDILTDLQDKTQLTRRSIVRILLESQRLQDFTRNPQQFIEMATEAINRTKSLALIDGIKYQKIGDHKYYAQEFFEEKELMGYLKNTIPATKSVHEHIVYDSAGIEKNFAEDLEANEAVRVYAKLPAWFQVPTPLGSYNPDWAILIEDNGQEKLYFVVETKGSIWWDDLRGQEGAKIRCAKKHFKEIATDNNPAQYITATSLDEVTRCNRRAGG